MPAIRSEGREHGRNGARRTLRASRHHDDARKLRRLQTVFFLREDAEDNPDGVADIVKQPSNNLQRRIIIYQGHVRLGCFASAILSLRCFALQLDAMVVVVLLMVISSCTRC